MAEHWFLLLLRIKENCSKSKGQKHKKSAEVGKINCTKSTSKQELQKSFLICNGHLYQGRAKSLARRCTRS